MPSLLASRRPPETIATHRPLRTCAPRTLRSSCPETREQQTVVLQNLEARRESVSGVSIDEEVTHLIRLQAAFEANARVIGTIDEILDDLLSIL